jgi:hypothetical protein
LGAREPALSERRLNALFLKAIIARNQCAALSFVAPFASHLRPSFALEFNVATELSSAALLGRVLRLLRELIHLLLGVEGLVQKVPKLVPKGCGTRYRVPVTLTVGQVGLVQLLMAVAPDAPLATIAQREGEEASANIALLAAEIKRQSVNIEFYWPL